LGAAIDEVEASYDDRPSTENINLEDAEYSKALGLILTNVLLNSDDDTNVEEGEIVIGENKIKITDFINALLTGGLILNGDKVEGRTGTITLADGTQVDIPDADNVFA